MKYKTFIESKRVADPATGLGKVPHLNDKLFDFQRDKESYYKQAALNIASAEREQQTDLF